MTNEKRWIDSHDFTPKHDQLTVWLNANWKLVLDHLDIVIIKNWTIIEKKFELEPILPGYIPLYPDAVLTMALEGHHAGLLKINSKRKDAYGHEFTCLSCPAYDCERSIEVESDRLDNSGTTAWNTTHKCTKSVKVLFEIKPTIVSLGETLRQISSYRQRMTFTHTVLITNDDRYDGIFNEQNIKVIHPDKFSMEYEDNVHV